MSFKVHFLMLKLIKNRFCYNLKVLLHIYQRDKMTDLALIFIGAGFGGILRYWVSNSIYWAMGLTFPYGTLVVNATGCFLMGALYVLIIEKVTSLEHPLRALLLVGLLGGYTTFSSFSVETLILLERGAWFSALMNVTFSILLCISLTWAGIAGMRTFQSYIA